MLLSKIEIESKGARSATLSATAFSSLNKYPRCLPKIKHKIQKNSPIVTEVLTKTLMENFAALASPFPSSFAIRTLYEEKNEGKKGSSQKWIQHYEIEMNHRERVAYQAAPRKPRLIINSHPLTLRLQNHLS